MTRRLLRRHGRERFSGPLGVDDEPKGIHLRVDLTERGERPRAATQKRGAVRVPDETQLDAPGIPSALRCSGEANRDLPGLRRDAVINEVGDCRGVV
jgi:hypothetical protein